MSDALANLLDFPVAWLRVKADLASRVFVRPVLETRIVESDLQVRVQPAGKLSTIGATIRRIQLTLKLNDGASP